MKNLSKILALNLISLVVIFWMLSLQGISPASPQNPTILQLTNQNELTSKAKKPSSDSLAKVLCDKKPPYFRNLNPDSAEQNVTLHPIIKFDVYDDFTPKKNEWDRYGINTDSIFIVIKCRFWQITHRLEGPEITLLDSIFRVHCEYQPSQSFDWSDTVTCSLYVWDVSYLKNFADTVYTFYTISDTMKPELIAVYPESAMVNVPIDSGIIIHGTDEGRGVVFNDVVLKINDSTVAPIISGDSLNFMIYYNPTPDWTYSDSIHVFCKVHDKDGNLDSLDYWFKTAAPPDTIAPEIIPLYPLPEADNVSVDTTITFAVRDRGAHVDTSKIAVAVNSESDGVVLGKLRKWVIQKDSVFCEFSHEKYFLFNDLIDVKIDAADSVGNPATADYFFWTQDSILEDTIAPNIEVIRPKRDAENVSIDTDIVLYVTDDVSGVDTSSAVFKVNDQVINLNDINFIYDGVGDTVHYKPPLPFNYSSEVKIDFQVADSAGNQADTNYSFYTESELDTLPPIVYDHDPAIYGFMNTLDDSIKFKVRDNSGVDTFSITTKISINGGPFQFLNTLRQVSRTGDTVAVKSGLLHFNYGDSVHVEIYAKDNLGNHTDTTGKDSTVFYYFKVVQDTTPPDVTMLEPVIKNDVPLQQSVKLEITDSQSRVDINSISVNINGDKGYSSTKSVLQQIDDHTWLVTHAPEPEYHEDELITIALSVSDLAGNRTSFVDSFRTIKTLTNLQLVDFYSSNGQSPVKEGSNVKLTATIGCENKDCLNSFSVCFLLDDKKKLFVNDSMKNGEMLTIDTTIVASFGESDSIKVEAIVDYYNDIPEENEGDNAQTLYLIKNNNKQAKLIVQPNPFTPNDDGYNDETIFNFEQYGVEDPSIKIFDMHGRKVRELNQPNSMRFAWNGTDGNGSHLLPGMYLYIFSDKNNALARGCIVIVR